MTDLKTWTIGGTKYRFADTAARDEIETLKKTKTTEVADVSKRYLCPEYTQGTLNSDGTINASGTGYVTDMLPVVAGETLLLNSNTISRVAYFDSTEAFLSLVSTSNGLVEYIVPNNAAYAIYQVVYNNGSIRPLLVRHKEQPKNTSFSDLILSPIKSSVGIVFTGDSNTVGYGLSNAANSWANLFGAELEKITELQYEWHSPWVEPIGFKANGTTGVNFVVGSQITIWTDAESVAFEYGSNYSSAWDIFVDDTKRTDMANAESITLDGELHKITIKFTAGQLTDPRFTIPKTITFTNKAVSGVGMANVVVPDATTADWMFVMVGTNNRGGGFNANQNWNTWAGRGTYIFPAPNHKTDGSYVYSQMLVYAKIADNMKNRGLDILNVSSVMGGVFLDNSLYQQDLIHYNEKGHKAIANIVSGALGLPCYFAAE